jgi:riboflavin synthase, alpha subunit
MFTGIVQEMGTVKKIQPQPGGARIEIVAPRTARELSVGDSVCTQGACLTCISKNETSFVADLSQETLDRTTLGRLKPGDEVNLELALRLSDRLGGHLVTGHVDGVGRLQSERVSGDGKVLTFSAPAHVMRYVVEKGSICVDGVSLTIAGVLENGFSVAVIPHTLQVTTLGKLRPGDPVNLEADLIGKYVEKLLGPRPANDLWGALRQAGFLAPSSKEGI